MFLGDDLLPYLVLAFGGALFVGNVLALIRPPLARADVRDEDEDDQHEDDERPRPPLGRTVLMASIGFLASLWALASLVAR